MSQCTKFHAAGRTCWDFAVFFLYLMYECVLILGVCFKFCVNLRKIQRPWQWLKQAFRDQSMSCISVFEWQAWFKFGCTGIEYDDHTRRPINSTMFNIIIEVQHLIHEDQCWNIQDLDDEMGIDYGTLQRILLHESGLHCVSVKFVPRILSFEHKEQCVAVCRELCQVLSKNQTFLFRLITGGESWIYS